MPEWQPIRASLLANNLLRGEGNLVYTAPTGGGKSLVADVLMLKYVVENPDKKAILVLPYVALVQEKLRWLRSAVDGVTKKTIQERQASRTTAQARRSITIDRILRRGGVWSDFGPALRDLDEGVAGAKRSGPRRASGSRGTPFGL